MSLPFVNFKDIWTHMYVIAGAPINSPRSNYQTPLHLAAMAGDLEIAELLTQHGARIDPLDTDQQTPLFKAAAFNHVDVVKFLATKYASNYVSHLSNKKSYTVGNIANGSY